MGKIEDLEKIKKLKDNGILTEEEFNAEKAKILNENNIDNTNNKTNIVEEVVKTKEKTTPNNVEIKSTKKIQKILFIVTGILIIVAIVLFCVHTSCKTNARGIVTNSFEEYRTLKSSLSRISDTCEIIFIIFGVISLATLCVGLALKIRNLKIKNGKIFKSTDKKETKELSKEELKNIRRKSNKITLIIIGICFLISLFIAGVSLLSNNIITNIVEQKKIEIEELNKRTVPNVEGMTYTEAKETLEEAGFECNASSQWGYTYDGYVVYEQSPKADTESSKGESVKISLKKIITEESDNYYGMRFTKTLSEFCNDYNSAIDTIYEKLELSTVLIDLYKISPSKFSYYQTYNNMRQYSATMTGYSIYVFLENDSDYIVMACVGVDFDAKFGNVDNFISNTLVPSYIATTMSLTDLTYSTSHSIYESTVTSGILYKDNANVAFYLMEHDTDSSIIYFYVNAISEEKYTEYTNNSSSETEETDTETESTSNDAIIEDINDRISFLNTYYDYDFEPTDEQMEEIIEFYNSTEDFDNDKLKSFLEEKGWVTTNN